MLIIILLEIIGLGLIGAGVFYLFKFQLSMFLKPNYKVLIKSLCFLSLAILCSAYYSNNIIEEKTSKDELYLTKLQHNVFNKEAIYVFYSTATEQSYISTYTEDYNNIKNTIGDKKVVDTLIVNGEYRILFSDKQTLKVKLKYPPSFKPNQEESLDILKNVS